VSVYTNKCRSGYHLYLQHGHCLKPYILTSTDQGGVGPQDCLTHFVPS